MVRRQTETREFALMTNNTDRHTDDDTNGDTNRGKEDESLVASVLTGFHRAGRFWRERVAPTIDRVNNGMRSAHDVVRSFSDDGQELRTKWNSLHERIQRGASDTISGLTGIYKISWDTLSGLHLKVGLAFIELSQLEALATHRKALAARELVAAKAFFDELRLKSEDANADLSADLAEMTRLVEAARKAILKVPYTIGTLRPMFINVTGALSEIQDLAQEYETKAGDYCARFGKAAYTAPPDAEAVAGLQSRFNELAPIARSLDALDIAVQLSDLDSDVSATRQAYVDAVDKFASDNQAALDLEGLMLNMLDQAETSGFGTDAELVAASQHFLLAVRQPPINLAAAEEHKTAYIARLVTLDPNLAD
jgi:hypothetical protein